MVQVVLIRPGRTDFDDQNRIQGMLDIPLNERGSHEVGETVEQLRGRPLEAIYSSPCQPSLGTAQMIAKALGLRLRVVDEFRNLNQGLWQGLQVEEVRRKHPRVYRQWEECPEAIRPPEGETMAEANQRLQKGLRPLLRRHRHQMIGIVAPEPISSIIRSCLKKSDLDKEWKNEKTEAKWELLEAAGP